jgi:hypothetical protein
LVAKLETSMSKVGAAVGAAPMAVRPSGPNGFPFHVLAFERWGRSRVLL